jgi:hypothetical protein
MKLMRREPDEAVTGYYNDRMIWVDIDATSFIYHAMKNIPTVQIVAVDADLKPLAEPVKYGSDMIVSRSGTAEFLCIQSASNTFKKFYVQLATRCSVTKGNTLTVSF